MINVTWFLRKPSRRVFCPLQRIMQEFTLFRVKYKACLDFGLEKQK